VGYVSGLATSCGVDHRCSSGLAFLWIWCGPAAAALISPLAWELPCATDVDTTIRIKYAYIYTLINKNNCYLLGTGSKPYLSLAWEKIHSYTPALS